MSFAVCSWRRKFGLKICLEEQKKVGLTMMENVLCLSLLYTCCEIISMEHFSLKIHVLLGILSIGSLLISENNS